MNEIEVELEEAATALLIPLRQGQGIDAAAADRLKSALEAAATAWAHTDVVPKSAANLFVDLAGGIQACSYDYGPESGRVMALADEIADLVRICVSQ